MMVIICQCPRAYLPTDLWALKTLKRELVLKDFLIFILLFSDRIGPKSLKQVSRQLLLAEINDTKTHLFFKIMT